MKKKKKRGQSLSSIGLILFAGIALFSVFVVLSLALFIGDSSNSFATEPWDDPFQVCTTQWHVVGEEENPPEIMDALSETGLTVTRVYILATNCTLRVGPDPLSYDSNSILITIDSTEQILADQEQIGFIIHDVLTAIKDTEISQNWDDSYGIGFQLTSEGNWRHRWSMNYIQAKRAVDAGLSGYFLVELGNFR